MLASVVPVPSSTLGAFFVFYKILVKKNDLKRAIYKSVHAMNFGINQRQNKLMITKYENYAPHSISV